MKDPDPERMKAELYTRKRQIDCYLLTASERTTYDRSAPQRYLGGSRA